MSATSPTWLELHIDRTGAEIQISARGSRGEQLAARKLQLEPERWPKFSRAVQTAAAQSQSLSNEVRAEAQAFQARILEGEIGPLFAKLQEAAQGPLLVRFFIHDSELQALPWEALCKQQESLGFWGTSPDIFPVRGVMSSAPWQPREVRGAVRVLAVAPNGSAGLLNLRQALTDRISSGEIEWLDPVEGAATKVTNLFDRLRREPIPHVLHFLGHGRIEKGIPELRLADDDDEETWIEAELLAQQLAANFQGMLRLVILEACEGASPGALGSAAEILARSGADGVIAHLWPVRADVARTCSTQFYRALAASDRNTGDIAAALNEARRAMLGAYDASAEALSPVLYLRGQDGQIFRFKGRKIAAPNSTNTPPAAAAGDVPGSLARMLRTPYSLVLGDMWTDDQAALEGFRDRLQKELTKLSPGPISNLPLSTLAEWFALRRGTEKLGNEFQKAFRATTEAPEIIGVLAKSLCPGVHTTMLRTPWLEQAVAEAHPQQTIWVIQPTDEGAIVLKREGGTDEWEELDAPPTEVDVDNEFVILRPCRGYTSEQVFTRPLLTDDDYSLRLRELWNTSVLPVDVANALLRTLGRRPGLILGLSLLEANHRLLLHNLFTRGVPRDTLALVDVKTQEGKLWATGAGLPGRSEGVEALETTVESLISALESLTTGGAR